MFIHRLALETYFARSLGYAMIIHGLLVVVLTGAVPLTSADGKPGQLFYRASSCD